MDDIELNNISKKLFENYRIKRPPEDFTDKVMLRIQQAKNPVKETNLLFGKKFISFFILTFATLGILGFIFSDKSVESGPGYMEKLKVSQFDISRILELLNLNIEIGLFAKLIIASIVILVIVDLLTGSIIDRFLDYRSKK